MPEHRFRAMDTEIRLVIVGGHPGSRRSLERAARAFAVYERSLSRFDPESELSVLNRSGSQWQVVSPLLFRALATAHRLSESTGGLFNPAILPALEGAGYDRSFESLASGERGPLEHDRPANLRPVA